MATWYPTEFERYLTLLQAIEREPRWKTTRQLADLLASKEGLAATDRTVQRILEYFKERFGLRSRARKGERGSPQEWAWPKRGGTIPFPTMDAPAALTLQLAADLLAPLLPAAFLDELEPEFRRAQKVLGLASRRATSLAGKLKVLPRGTGRLPAHIEPRVIQAVEHCLMHGRQLFIVGRLISRHDDQLELLVHPLALVFRFDTMYLVAGIEDTDGGHTDWIALHRVEHAECIDEPAVSPPGFDLERTLQEIRRHRLPFPLFDDSDKPIRLRVRILQPDVLDTLEERPFSSDQTISRNDEEGWLLQGTVPLTRDLLNELQALGDTIEVLHPSQIRSYLHRNAERLARHYSKNRVPSGAVSVTAEPYSNAQAATRTAVKSVGLPEDEGLMEDR